MNALLAISALTCGNFINQAFGAELWSVALERSFFQAGAVAVYIFIDKAGWP